MWWTIFVRNGGKAHIDQLLLTNLNYEWQRNSERRESVLPLHLFTRDTQNCKSQLKQRPTGQGIRSFAVNRGSDESDARFRHRGG